VIVDDDTSVRKSLARLLRVHGYETETYASADGYLTQAQDIQAACLILDLQMPGTDGMELQHRLIAAGADTAIVFLTGHGDIPTSVQAMKLGAVDFLTKPVDEHTLTEAVNNAIIKQSEMQRQRTLTKSVQERLATLTRREREVMQEVMTGAMNKQIAAHFGISEKTVKVHRAHVMQKMQTSSAAELVQLCARANLLPGTPANHPDRQ
jgi:FixJ family two-component response regulator